MILLLTAIGGVIAIRFTTTLDLNKFLEYRQERQVAKMRAACPHTILVEVPINGHREYRWKTLAVDVDAGDGVAVKKITVCSRCGTQLLGGLAQANDARLYFERDPDAWLKQEAYFLKVARKLMH